MLASVLSRRLLPRTAAALHGALPATALAVPPLVASPPARSFSASSDAKIGRDALADILCKEYGLKMSESRRIMDTVFDTIVEAVTNKETVSISGFGKFVPTMSAGRNYRNIQTGASVYKGPTMKVKFRPYKHFKECVEEGKFEK
ncbi:hypothetical protein ACHAXT_013264 [Thalassiosira profunda]